MDNLKQRSNKIWEIYVDGVFTDIRRDLNNWNKPDSRKRICKLRNDEVDAALDGRYMLSCPHCEAPVKIRYLSGERHPYLRHYFESVKTSCPLYCNPDYDPSEVIRARKYEGRTKDGRHDKTVRQLAQVIRRMDEAELLQEPDSKRLYHKDGSKQYRVPDLFFRYRDRRVVIEVQNSPEWIHHIAGRQKFYRENGIDLLWVFTSSRSVLGSISSKDIGVRQNFNAFFFSDDLYKDSLDRSCLIMSCEYDRLSLNKEGLIYRVREQSHRAVVSLPDLIFSSTLSPFYYDYENEHTRFQAEAEHLNHRERMRQAIDREIDHCRRYEDKADRGDYKYYRYMLDSGYYAVFGRFPSDIKVTDIQHLNNLAQCFMSCIYLRGALQRAGKYDEVLLLDLSGKLRKKFNAAHQFWMFLKQERYSEAYVMFVNNKRTTQLTIDDWDKTINAGGHYYWDIFPKFKELNLKAIEIIERVKLMIECYGESL